MYISPVGFPVPVAETPLDVAEDVLAVVDV
jgi:hypothetical protein